ncbi:MAG: hypothetical protein IPK32_15045 [Verrucomicrobiaceae bacterium]|nr:hypothetical protein [Verrucomicrobiaceae bacterium]
MQIAADALPQEFLIDPDSLISEVPAEEMTRFLEFHARDARIRIFVLVLPSDRQIPTVAELEKAAGGTLTRTDSCLVAFPLSEPWRARLFVSKSVHEQTSASFLSETAHACLRNALEVRDPVDQLQQFCTELSTRLFWLQQTLIGERRKSGETQPLREMALQQSADSFSGALTPSLSLFSIGWRSVILLVLLLLTVTGIALWMVRRFLLWSRLQRQNHIWLLPEVEPTSRLGGAFTGGGGFMIRY